MRDQGHDEDSSRRICGRLQADAEMKGDTIFPFGLRGIFKAISTSPRIIAGYANVAMVDHQGDLITVQAWEKAASRFMASNFRNVNLVHSNITVGEVIPEFKDSQGQLWTTHVDENGFFTVAEIREDLLIADKTWQLIEQGKLTEFSISGNALPGKTQVVCERGKGCFRKIEDLGKSVV